MVALLTDLHVAGSRKGRAIAQATSERLRNTDIADIGPFIDQPDHV